MISELCLTPSTFLFILHRRTSEGIEVQVLYPSSQPPSMREKLRASPTHLGRDIASPFVDGISRDQRGGNDFLFCGRDREGR